MSEAMEKLVMELLADALLFSRNYTYASVRENAQRLNAKFSANIHGYTELLWGWDDSLIVKRRSKYDPTGDEYRLVRDKLVKHLRAGVESDPYKMGLIRYTKILAQCRMEQGNDQSNIVRLGLIPHIDVDLDSGQSSEPGVSDNEAAEAMLTSGQINSILPESQPSSDAARARDTAGWTWNPVPSDESEPDPAPEDAHSTEVLPNGMRVIGARTRGKKHKLEGTHCDDCYAWGSSGPWTIVAVADGAGSKRASRVGARVSCEKSVAFLTAHFAKLTGDELPTTRSSWVESLQRDAGGCLASPLLSKVQECLVGALRESKLAVKAAYEERVDQGDWFKSLGRQLEFKDFRSTLLLTVLRQIDFDGERRTLCMHVQVGDGAAIACYGSQSGEQMSLYFQPLATSDSGEFSSETEFLVDFDDWSKAQLRVGILPAPVRWLFCMTDGVDDVFEPRSGRGYSWLLGELLLNQVLALGTTCTTSMAKAADERIIAALNASQQSRSVRLLQDPEPIHVLDVGLFASSLGTTVDELLTEQNLLRQAIAHSKPVCESEDYSKRLLAWIDGKDVKGEFDDRTLVVVEPFSG